MVELKRWKGRKTTLTVERENETYEGKVVLLSGYDVLDQRLAYLKNGERRRYVFMAEGGRVIPIGGNSKKRAKSDGNGGLVLKLQQ